LIYDVHFSLIISLKNLIFDTMKSPVRHHRWKLFTVLPVECHGW